MERLQSRTSQQEQYNKSSRELVIYYVASYVLIYFNTLTLESVWLKIIKKLINIV